MNLEGATVLGHHSCHIHRHLLRHEVDTLGGENVMSVLLQTCWNG